MHPSPSHDVGALDSYLKDLADFVGHLGFDLEDGWRVAYRDNLPPAFVSPSSVEYQSYVEVAEGEYGATPLSVEESRDGKIIATWSRVVSIDARRQEYLLQDAAYVLKNGVGCVGTDDAFRPPGDVPSDLDLESRAIIECDGCLRHFPPCDVDQGVFSSENRWYCAMCLDDDSKFAPMEDSRRSACSEFLQGNMRICSIEEIRSVDAEFKLKVRWYITPEMTAGGRELFHIRREIFLRKTDNPDEIDVGDLRRHALVLPREFFDEARQIPGYHAADDLFLCEHAYDEKTGSFDPLFQELFELDGCTRRNPRRKGNNNHNSGKKPRSRKRKLCDGIVQPQIEEVAVPRQLGKFGRIRQLLDPRLKAHDDSRERHANDMKDLISKIVQNNSQVSLFVTGCTGTGKTTTVERVILRLNGEIGGLKFKSAHVNCVGKTPALLLNTIAGKLFDKHFKKGGRNALQEYFGEDSQPITVLVLDEIDELLSRQLQEVWDMILSWKFSQKSKLVLIGISNLPSNKFSEKLIEGDQSRFRTEDIPFAPYSHDELISIARARLGTAFKTLDDCFVREAIDIASRRVHGGDVRRFLNLCIQATWHAEARCSAKHIDTHDQKVEREDFDRMYESDSVQLIKGLSLYQRTLLLALLDEPAAEIDQSSLFDKSRGWLQQTGSPLFQNTQPFRFTLYKLQEQNLVAVSGISPRDRKVGLHAHLQRPDNIVALFETFDRDGISWKKIVGNVKERKRAHGGFRV